MTIEIVADHPIRYVVVKHQCDPGTGGGTTYRATYIEVPHGTPVLRWTGDPNQNNCAYCGEKLPKHPDEVMERARNGKDHST